MIARPGMILPWVTRVIPPLVEGSVLVDGSVTAVMFPVHRGTILQVILLVTVALELKSVFPTGSGRIVPCTAGRGMILLVNTSAR